MHEAWKRLLGPLNVREEQSRVSERTRAGEPEALFSGAGMAGDSFVLRTASSTSHNAKRLTPLQGVFCGPKSFPRMCINLLGLHDNPVKYVLLVPLLHW